MVHFFHPASLGEYYQGQVQRAQALFEALSFGTRPIQYEFVLKNPSSEKAIWSLKTAEEFIEKIPVLNENLQKYLFHVWFRPNVSSYIFLDDLTLTQARRLHREGYEPSAIVETSPGNFQAWICCSSVYIRGSHATAIARYLATRFQGDLSCCHYRHYGRMVGFPNVKEQYRDASGRYPITRLHYAQHRIISKSDELLLATKPEADRREASKELLASGSLQELWESLNDRLRVARKVNSGRSADDVALKLYREIESAKLRKGVDVADERSETDLAVVCSLIHRGFAIEPIAEGVKRHSFNIEKRKKGHLDDYLQRTIARALSNVIEERQLREEQVSA
ncbi:MAG: DNA-primase RepB domain-containing protein [Pleurocapsa sp. MO_226.B13]|nr:DNA-primase RepB domain-containing protein [Pleurocapsa sp. MO_226.B13]